MLNKNLKKTPKLIITLIVFSLSIFYFPTQSMLMADPAGKWVNGSTLL